MEIGCLVHGVDRHFFETARIPLRAGRSFTADDERDELTVAVVSERCARQIDPQGNVIGTRVLIGGIPDVAIVGVVGDARYDGVKRAPAPAVYVTRAATVRWRQVSVIVRASPGAGDVTQAVLAAARAVDPEQPIERSTTIDGLIREQLAQDRFQTVSTSAFASIALLLAVAGLAGAVSRSVSERTRELAVRGALGAAPRQLMTLAVRQGMQPVVMGLAVGLFGALAAARLLAGFLFEVSPLDPTPYAVAVVALIVAAVAACYLPARHAARVDPAVALRAE